jgi:hypothetical protein
MPTLTQRILQILVITIISTVAWEVVAFGINEATTANVPSLYGSYTKEPEIRVVSITQLDINTTTPLKVVQRGSSIDYASQILLDINYFVDIPLSLSKWGVVAFYDFAANQGSSEFLKFGLSNIYSKDKEIRLLLNLPSPLSATVQITLKLFNPEGILEDTGTFVFSITVP